MYQSLTATLKTQFEAIDEIAEVFTYPDPNPSRYPALIFFPMRADNSFNDNQDNLIEHTFKVWIIVGETPDKSMEATANILNGAVDAFIANMKTNWSITGEDGKTWSQISNLEFGYSVSEHGYTHTCAIDLLIKTKY